MSVTVPEFRERFPEFSPPQPPIASDEEIQIYIDLAIKFLNETRFEDCNFYDEAVCYLAAHYLFIAISPSGTTETGPVSSKRAGEVMVSFGMIGTSTATLSDGFFSSTKYGRIYMQIRDIVWGGEPVVVC
jgi:hypothetical protein